MAKQYRNLFIAITTLALAACGGAAETEADTAATATSQDQLSLTVTPIVEGLEFPWALAVLPSGDMLVSEREGRLNLLNLSRLRPRQ